MQKKGIQIRMRFEMCIYYFSVFTVLVLSGCSMAIEAGFDAMPPNNKTMVVNANSKLDIEKKVYFNLHAPKLTPISHAKWRNEYIKKALQEAGIKNYQILSSDQTTLNPEEVKDSYLMVLSVTHWTVNDKGKDSCTDLWVPATLAIFELPEKKEVIRLSGESSDCKYYGWSIGKLVSSLLEEMLKKAYQS